jgi:hypothetical protein
MILFYRFDVPDELRLLNQTLSEMRTRFLRYDELSEVELHGKSLIYSLHTLS